MGKNNSMAIRSSYRNKNRLSKSDLRRWGSGYSYAPSPFDQLQNLASGYDVIKTATGSETKSRRKQQKQVAHGWYVDYISGIQHDFPKGWDSILKNNGRFQNRVQKPLLSKTALSRTTNETLLEQNTITDINSILPSLTSTQSAYITTGNFKVMFTNLSNVKMCYEFYYVTPKAAAANQFDTLVTTLGNPLTNPDGLFDVFTNWKPEDYPELLKAYRVLGKSCFRLGPGETGELHGKDKFYKKLGLNQRLTQRNYTEGLNTQLYCRWYGAPTALADVTVVPPAAPVIGNTTDAVFGDFSLATSFIMEQTVNWYYADTVNLPQTTYGTTVNASIPANKTVVVHENVDDEVTAAD